jgi:FkbM family methyltransferase
MYIFLRRFLRSVFSAFNLGLVKNKDLINLQQTFIDYTCLLNKLNFFSLFDKKLYEIKSKSYSDINFLVESKSQNGQDLFALLSNDFKSSGVFIEFGAYDGVIFSNTHLLEKQFGWTGILIDPIPSHYESMKQNRKCQLIHGAITAEHQESVLIEELPASDLSRFVNKRKIFKKVHKVKAFTLQEVIDQNLSSNEIDFLSIDIEGNDIDILKSLDLSRNKIKAISVEHNFRKGSDNIINYMSKNRYDLVFSQFSKNDYWFVLRK